MLIIRRKNLVIGLLVVLLVITGYLNFIYNNSNTLPADTPADGLNDLNDRGIADDPDGGKIESHVTVSDLTDDDSMTGKTENNQHVAEASSTSFFMDYRFERELTRKKEIEYISKIIDNPKFDPEIIAEAQAQLLEITSNMEKEMAIETLLKSKGFSDAVAIIYRNNINVIVDKPELEVEEVARILDIVSRQAGEKPENIIIIPKM
jgi:stage III sporulation protein AH